MSNSESRYPRRKHLPPIGSPTKDRAYDFPKKELAIHRRIASRGTNGSQPTQFSYSDYKDHSEDIHCHFCKSTMDIPTIQDISRGTIMCLACMGLNRLPKHLLLTEKDSTNK